MKCETCRWWARFDIEGNNGKACQRYPPVPVVIPDGDGGYTSCSLWPMTHASNGCAEWKPFGWLLPEEKSDGKT